MGLSGADYVVVRLRLLQHAPHGIDVIAGEAPVTARVEVAERKLFGQTELYARSRVGDFARDELETATRALVVEEDARDRVECIALAIVHGDPVSVYFRHAIRRPRIERRRLAL